MARTPSPTDKRCTMNISLTPELKEFVDAKVEGGFYTSASEVVREGLRLLAEEHQIKELRRQEFRERVRVGLEELKRGEGVDGDAVFDRLTAELDEQEKRTGKT